jgi:hypothetical protein
MNANWSPFVCTTERKPRTATYARQKSAERTMPQLCGSPVARRTSTPSIRRYAAGKHGQGAHEGGGPPVDVVEEIGHREVRPLPRASREEEREEERADVVGSAEDEPVREAVEVGVLADPEDAAVPRRDERHDE